MNFEHVISLTRATYKDILFNYDSTYYFSDIYFCARYILYQVNCDYFALITKFIRS